MKKSRYMLPILVLALFPSTASANAGTPLMWASMLHLVFGNAIIGLVEGLLLAWMFKCSKRKSILILIAANYASAWAGGFFVAGYLASLPDITIQTIQYWFLVLVLVAFVVTLLIEFPFFWFALRSRDRPLRRALIATPVVHGISYALLFGWYWMASGTSMMTKLEVVSADELKVSEPYLLYFISSGGDQILRMDLSDYGSSHLVSEVAVIKIFDTQKKSKKQRLPFDRTKELDGGCRSHSTKGGLKCHMQEILLFNLGCQEFITVSVVVCAGPGFVGSIG